MQVTKKIEKTLAEIHAMNNRGKVSATPPKKRNSFDLFEPPVGSVAANALKKARLINYQYQKR